MTTPTFRYLGTTDESTECERCGKTELRSTVVLALLDADGNPDGDPVYYGSTCAARALGAKSGRAVLQSARAAHHDTLTAASDARRMLAVYGLPEVGEIGTTNEDYHRAVDTYRQYNRVAQGEDFARVLGRVRDFVTRKRAAIQAATLVEPVCSFCQTTH